LLALDEGALRKVDSALVELDACRERDAVMAEQMANLNAQLETKGAMVTEQAAAMEKLNQALAAKDQVVARNDAEHRAELKVVRGTLLARLGRVVEHVAIGVAIGVVLVR
jgi:hypothetical protein